MTNIKDDPAYDSFPKSGPVKQYEQFIRDYVRDFCRRYPHLNPQDVLFRAVELAIAAERTFKPELGFSFATHVGHRLKELHRLHEKQERAEGVPIYRTEEDLAHEKAEEEGEPTDPVNFAGGGNGVRLLFDLQWWEALLSDLISRASCAKAITRSKPISAYPQTCRTLFGNSRRRRSLWGGLERLLIT
jgi:hypothetical protein